MTPEPASHSLGRAGEDRAGIIFTHTKVMTIIDTLAIATTTVAALIFIISIFLPEDEP